VATSELSESVPSTVVKSGAVNQNAGRAVERNLFGLLRELDELVSEIKVQPVLLDDGFDPVIGYLPVRAGIKVLKRDVHDAYLLIVDPTGSRTSQTWVWAVVSSR